MELSCLPSSIRTKRGASCRREAVGSLFAAISVQGSISGAEMQSLHGVGGLLLTPCGAGMHPGQACNHVLLQVSVAPSKEGCSMSLSRHASSSSSGHQPLQTGPATSSVGLCRQLFAAQLWPPWRG